MFPITRAADAFAGLGRWQRLGLMALLGVVAALGHAPVAEPGFSLLALFGVFLLRPWRLGPRRAFWAGWGFAAGYFLVTFHWLVEPFLVDIARHGWMAPFAVCIMAGGLALFWGAAFAVAGWRQSGVVLCVGWALAELLRAHVFTGFPWAMLVTAWVDRLGYQTAGWTGPYGLTLLLLIGVWASLRWRIGAIAAVGLLAVTVAPAPRGAEPAPDAPLIRVVQPNAPQGEKWDITKVDGFFQRGIEATRAGEPADLTIWPEVVIPEWLRNAKPRFDAMTEATGAKPVLAGVRRWDGRPYNGLALVAGAGTLIGYYEKAHLVPFGEYMPLASVFSRWGIFGLAAEVNFGYAPGPGPAVMDVPGIGKVQPMICYEGIFPHFVLRGDQRPALLSIVTNDAWFGTLGGPAQHLAQAQARAIEFGLPVARSANTGISAVIDARGHVVAAQPLGTQGFAQARLPHARPETLYSRAGELPFVVLIGLMLLLQAIAGHLGWPLGRSRGPKQS